MICSNVSLERAARKAWADLARAQRWTLWARLSWAWPVSEIAAGQMLDRWAEQMIARVPGASALVGIHDDAERRHAHALIFVPKKLTRPIYPEGVGIVGWCWPQWLNIDWKHGQVWADWFTPSRTVRGSHGAAEYLAKNPGMVMQYGLAPRYKSEKHRGLTAEA